MFRLLKMSKPNAYSKLAEEGFSDADKIMYEAGMSVQFRKMIREMTPKMLEIIENLKIEAEIIKTAKNDLFTHLEGLQEMEKVVASKMIENMELQKFLLHWNTLETDERFNIYNILELDLAESTEKSDTVNQDTNDLDEIPLNSILEIG